MQAVILAGGLGTRLRPLTQAVPKPMVPVGGRPFLEHIVSLLAAQDFRRMLLLTGYLGEQVSDHFGDGSRFGTAIEYCREPAPLGTAGAIHNALARLDSSFLLLYGDSYLPIDYRLVAGAFARSPRLGLMVVYENRLEDTGVPNNVAIDAAGRVVRYEKGSGDASLRYVEAGVLCFRREVFSGLPAGESVSLEQDIFPALCRQGELGAYVTRQRFFDIGTAERLQEFAEARP